MQDMLDKSILAFLKRLTWKGPLPEGVEVLSPFSDPVTWGVCEAFYHRFYHDDAPRTLLIGINPGRFGGGVTGIPFTDPIRLQTQCGIDNPWPKKQELSSVFMYEMIRAYGGPRAFYQKFYITSVSPLGFTLNGKNLNYYDDPQLTGALEPFAADCLRLQLGWGIDKTGVDKMGIDKTGMDKTVAFCLGGGKNFTYLERLNNKYGFFGRIVPLPHPRYIMQYQSKQKAEHILDYLEKFNTFLP
jgi:hypothetical protein